MDAAAPHGEQENGSCLSYKTDFSRKMSFFLMISIPKKLHSVKKSGLFFPDEFLLDYLVYRKHDNLSYKTFPSFVVHLAFAGVARLCRS
jgi:hypothetical protein